ncbi:hypothetical protein [Anaerotruncus rubiinfantis]|uniref:hypothetical protein n=1 Tax=Anaerotruncus rubiinfantis TaxID=1720200 RepID=UPI0011CC5760|nr:hypothetical protein [Anaerotruncus rubiinfantis]
MKKTMTIVLVGLLALSLTACGQPAAPEGPTVADVQAEKAQLEQLLTERDAQIEALTGQVEEQTGQIEELSNQLEEAWAALQTAQAALEEATAEPEEPTLPESGSQPQIQSSTPAKSAPAPTASSAPTATTNADGSRSLTISLDDGGTTAGKRASETGGTTRKQAEEYLSYLREYAESKGMIWTEDAKDGGFEPPMDTEGGKEKLEAGIRSMVDSLIRAERTYIYGELQPDSRVQDEWEIVVYR